MKKNFLILSFFLLHAYFCIAHAQNSGKITRVEAIKVAYITKELSLTSDEAQRFWPVYNNYNDEILKAKQANLKDEVTFEQEVVNIKKKYKPEFKKVLVSDERVNKIFTVDRNYRDLLRNELQKRQDMKKRP